MASGLSVSDVVKVDVNLSPTAAALRNFGAMLIVGSSDVIDTNERLRRYTTLDGVSQDFGINAAEYLAADLFFSQSPQPSILYVGRFAQSATKGRLNGGVLTAGQQEMSNFTSISDGSMEIDVDESTDTLSDLDFSGETNLNGVASVIDTALTGASCTWDSVTGRFVIESDTTGASSTIGYASSTGSGTDMSALLKFDSDSASAPVDGIIAETPAACIEILANKSNLWYGAMFAVSTALTVDEHLDVAAFIEGAGISHIYGAAVTSTTVLDSQDATDLASQLMTGNYKRSFCQYSSSSPHAVASIFGRAFTVDFTASNTTITLKFKQEPGVTAETLTESQAATLKAKNCNVFVSYANDTAIIQEGVMANGYFFDEVHGTDWLQNYIQTNVFNLLYQSTTKVPQTDAGVHLIVNTIEAAMSQAVTNGLVAPGVWNAGGFGQLSQGDTLTRGFYVYAPLVSSQAQADREARKAPTIQIAAKLAGAVHTINCIVNVNR